MRSRARHTLLIALLALYGVLAVASPALHAVAGPTHAQADGGGDADRPAADDGDCPICAFLAQAQLGPDGFRLAAAELVRPEVAPLAPPAWPPAIARPSSPRAPPFA